MIKANLTSGTKSLNLIIDSPKDKYNGRYRNDLSTVKVWCYLTSGADLVNQSPPTGNLVYDGLSLQIHIPNLTPNTRYYVKYALVSSIDPSPLGYTVSDELSQFVYANPTEGTDLVTGDGSGGFKNLTLGTGLSLSNNTLKTDGLAKTTESYIVIENSNNLTNERRLAQGRGILIVDDGANNAVTISLGGGGALTQIGLGTPANFFLNVSNSPLTVDGNMGLSYSPGNALPVTSGGTGRADLGSGLLKGNGTGAVITANVGTDYVGPTSGQSLLMGDGKGGLQNVSIGDNIAFSNNVISADFTKTSPVENINIISPLLSTGGVAPNITLGIVPIAKGGTEANNRQSAINNLVQTKLVGTFLRGDGNNAIMSSIQSSDLAGLNINAAYANVAGNVTVGVVGIVNGGTGASTATNARLNLLPNVKTKATKFLRVNSTETDLEWTDVILPTLNSSNSVVGVGNLGRINGEADGTKEPANVLTLRSSYNNNFYPAPYGNILTLGGEGGGELFIGWPGSGGTGGDATVSADNFIRSRRDVSSNWSQWALIITSLNARQTFSNVAFSGSYADLSAKPSLANVAFSGQYAELLSKPNIPNAQVSSDWNATAGVSLILNKPVLAISNLTDANVVGVSNGQALIYNSVNKVWAPGNVSAGSATTANTANYATYAGYADLAGNVNGKVAVINGGTGADSPYGARVNILPPMGSGTAKKVLTINATGSDVNWEYTQVAPNSSNAISEINVSSPLNIARPNINVVNVTLNTVPVESGGTGQQSRLAAINNLAANNVMTYGTYLRGDGTNLVMSKIQVFDLAGFNIASNVTGSAGTITSVLGVTQGGTGQQSRQNAINFLAANNVATTGTYLQGDGTNLIMGGIQAAHVPTLNQNTTGSAGSLISSYILPATQGGTGQGGTSPYAIGDLLYASSTTALSKLAAVAAGSVLLSRGTNTPPAYGKINLQTMVEGTLQPSSGGTGGSSGGGNLGTPTAITLTNATGLPLTTGTAGILPIAKGGTGRDALTSGALLMGNGDALINYAVAGTHYADRTQGANLLASNGAGGFTQVGLSGPLSYSSGTLTCTALSNNLSYVWPAQQTFNRALFVGSTEAIVINTTAPTNNSIVVLTATTASVLYTTANPTGVWNLNVVGVSTLLTQNSQSLTVVHMVLNGGTAYYQIGFRIDGSAQNPRWLNASAPTSGNANSIDVYTFTIIRTASGVYTTLGSVTRYG